MGVLVSWMAELLVGGYFIAYYSADFWGYGTPMFWISFALGAYTLINHIPEEVLNGQQEKDEEDAC